MLAPRLLVPVLVLVPELVLVLVLMLVAMMPVLLVLLVVVRRKAVRVWRSAVVLGQHRAAV